MRRRLPPIAPVSATATISATATDSLRRWEIRSTMNQGQSRIPCPRCRANNFPGKTHCWQCRSPLPPPEAVQPAVAPPAAAVTPPAAAVQPPVSAAHPPFHAPAPQAAASPIANRPPRSALRFALPVGLGLAVVILAALLFSSRPTPSHRAAVNEFAREQAQLEEQLRRMNRGDSFRFASPEEEQARRELRRLERQLETTAPPPAGSDGRVHLRSGGSLSREEYDRFLRDLNR